VTLRRIVISLDGVELSALNELAASERRDRQAQAAVIIHTELLRRGLLETSPAKPGVNGGCNDETFSNE